MSILTQCVWGFAIGATLGLVFVSYRLLSKISNKLDQINQGFESKKRILKD